MLKAVQIERIVRKNRENYKKCGQDKKWKWDWEKLVNLTAYIHNIVSCRYALQINCFETNDFSKTTHYGISKKLFFYFDRKRSKNTSKKNRVCKVRTFIFSKSCFCIFKQITNCLATLLAFISTFLFATLTLIEKCSWFYRPVFAVLFCGKKIILKEYMIT